MKKPVYVSRRWLKKLSNSLIIAGIAFFSSLAATKTFSFDNFYTALIAGALAGLIEVAHQKKVKTDAEANPVQSFFF